ncbi:MAG: UvrD-helicase domain-containing protein [Oceanospirillaceae bacterium]|nr:UvrD-helicase domain-containing protein [Oceanospirillaceae bacterium]
MTNRLVIASAGAGKTTFIVNEALANTEKKVLISTFTEANEKEIRKKIINLNGSIPPNITVQTWFSFLIQHGAKPYQGGVFEKPIRGMILVSGRSGIKYYFRRKPVYYSEAKEFERHYFTSDGKIYSDKLAKFVVRCNEHHKGAVIERIEKCFDCIFIDEVQDLAGYDLDILSELFESKSEILLVGDPRQGTYSTANAAKHKKYSKSKILHFFERIPKGLEIDDTSFTINHRCTQAICDTSNSLFPDMVPATSGNELKSGHDGIFLVKPEDVERYLSEFNPIQLRDKISVKTNSDYPSMNFGQSKGLTFERILVYPTNPMLNWLKDNNIELKPTSRSKLYVALTRASQSVGVICEYDKHLAEMFNYYE